MKKKLKESRTNKTKTKKKKKTRKRMRKGRKFKGARDSSLKILRKSLQCKKLDPLP